MVMLVRVRGQNEGVNFQQPGSFYNGNPSSCIWGTPPGSPLWQQRSGAAGSSGQKEEVHYARHHEGVSPFSQLSNFSPFAFGFPPQHYSTVSTGPPFSSSNPSSQTSSMPTDLFNQRPGSEGRIDCAVDPVSYEKGVPTTKGLNNFHSRPWSIDPNPGISHKGELVQSLNRPLEHAQCSRSGLQDVVGSGKHKGHVRGDISDISNVSESRCRGTSLISPVDDSSCSLPPFHVMNSSTNAEVNVSSNGETKAPGEAEKEMKQDSRISFVFGLKKSADSNKPLASSTTSCQRAGRHRKSITFGKSKGTYSGSFCEFRGNSIKDPNNVSGDSSCFLDLEPTFPFHGRSQAEVTSDNIFSASVQLSSSSVGEPIHSCIPTGFYQSCEMPKNRQDPVAFTSGTQHLRSSQTFKILNEHEKVVDSWKLQRDFRSVRNPKLRNNVYQPGIEAQFQHQLNRIQLSSVALSDSSKTSEQNGVVSDISESAKLGRETIPNGLNSVSGSRIRSSPNQVDCDTKKKIAVSPSHVFGKEWRNCEGNSRLWPFSFSKMSEPCSDAGHKQQPHDIGSRKEQIESSITKSQDPFVFKAIKLNPSLGSGAPEVLASHVFDVANSASASKLACTHSSSTAKSESDMHNFLSKQNNSAQHVQGSKIDTAIPSSFVQDNEAPLKGLSQTHQQFVFSAGSGELKSLDHSCGARSFLNSKKNAKHRRTSSFSHNLSSHSAAAAADRLHHQTGSIYSRNSHMFPKSNSPFSFSSTGIANNNRSKQTENLERIHIPLPATSDSSFVFRSTDKPRDQKVLKVKDKILSPPNFHLRHTRHLLVKRNKKVTNMSGANMSRLPRLESLDEGSPMDCSPNMETEVKGSRLESFSSTATDSFNSTTVCSVPFEAASSGEEEGEAEEEVFKTYIVHRLNKDIEVEELREAAADLNLGTEDSDNVTDGKQSPWAVNDLSSRTTNEPADQSSADQRLVKEGNFGHSCGFADQSKSIDANSFTFSALNCGPISFRRAYARQVRKTKVPHTRTCLVNPNKDRPDPLSDVSKFESASKLESARNIRPDILCGDAGGAATAAMANLSLQEPRVDFSHESISAEHVCEKWRIRGNEAYANGDFPKAEECYSRGVSSVSPHETSQSCIKASMLCYSNRAATRMAVGRMREALADCLRAMTVDPDFWRVRLRAASCHLALGETEPAVALFKESLKHVKDHPTNGKVRLEASDGLIKAQQVEEHIERVSGLIRTHSSTDASTALRLVNEALSSSPHSEKLFELKARALLLLRRYHEAVQLCEQTLPSAERNCPIVGSESQMQESSGNNCEGASNVGLRYSIKIWRQQVAAKVFFHLGQLEDSLEALKRVEEIDSSCKWSIGASCGSETVSHFISHISDLLRHKAAGNMAFQAGRHAEAIERYTAALACNGESRNFNAVLFCNRAAASQALGHVADAIADCSCAVVLDPTYAKAISRRATLHDMIRDYGHSCSDLQRLIDLLESQHEIARGVQANKLENSFHQDLKQARRRLTKAKEESKKALSLDYYRVLGVEPSCSANEIKKSYRKLALRHHPDKAGQLLVRAESGDDGDMWKEVGEEVCRDAERLFKLIGEAHAILSDSSKRMQYDNDEDIRKLRAKGSSVSTRSEHPRYHSEKAGRRHRDRWDSWAGYTHQYQRWQSGPDAAQPDTYACRGRYKSGSKKNDTWEFGWNEF